MSIRNGRISVALDVADSVWLSIVALDYLVVRLLRSPLGPLKRSYGSLMPMLRLRHAGRSLSCHRAGGCAGSDCSAVAPDPARSIRSHVEDDLLGLDLAVLDPVEAGAPGGPPPPQRAARPPHRQPEQRGAVLAAPLEHAPAAAHAPLGGRAH